MKKLLKFQRENLGEKRKKVTFFVDWAKRRKKYDYFQKVLKMGEKTRFDR